MVAEGMREFGQELAELGVGGGEVVAHRHGDSDGGAGADAVLIGLGVVGVVLQQDKVVHAQQPGGLPVVGHDGLLPVPGGGHGGAEHRVGAGDEVVVVLVQAVGLHLFLHDLGDLPAGDAAVDDALGGVLRVGEELGILGQVLHRLEIGVLVDDIAGDIEALVVVVEVDAQLHRLARLPGRSW